MKKLLTLLLTLLMVFTLVGCGSKEETPVVEEPEKQEVVEETKEEPEIVGGYVDVEDGTLTDELKDIFAKALESLLGAKYEPVELVATQVVAGTNYKFLANGTKTTNPITKGTYYVTVYEDLQGNVSLLDIETIEEKQEEAKVDPSQYSYWVVVYDQFNNEISRTTAKYGTIVKDPNGNDVLVNTNKYFHTTIDYSSDDVQGDYSPVPPTPIADCTSTDPIIYIKNYAAAGEIDFDNGSIIAQPIVLKEMYMYDVSTNAYILENILTTDASNFNLGPQDVGKCYHSCDGVSFTECNNPNVHNYSGDLELICSCDDGDTIDVNSNNSIRVNVCPHCQSDLTYSIKFGNTQPEYTYSISGDIVSFTKTQDDPNPDTVTIYCNADPNKSITFNIKSGAECLAAGTMITMADGSKKAIESLYEGDLIRVFDHNTGKVSSAKIMDYWQYEEKKRGLITLHFTNDIDVNIVDSHCFYNKEENKYILLRSSNIDNYVGKHFYNVDNDSWETLLGATYSDEKVDTFFIATEGQFDCVAEGMLSVEDGVYYALRNTFDFDNNMKIDEMKKANDIECYGLFDSTDFEYLTKEAFERYGAANLKVALGKGIITEEFLDIIKAESITYESENIVEEYIPENVQHSVR